MNDIDFEQQNTADTDALLVERYTQLPAELTDLIRYKTVSLVVEEIDTTYGLTQKKRALLENEIILTLLLFTPRGSFKENVQDSLEIDDAFAEAITDKVETDIFALVEPILTAAEKEFGDATEPEGAADPEAATTEVPSTKPASGSELMERLSALRTMQGDAERIHGYGAYRRRNEPTTNKPQPSTPPLAAPPRYVDTDEGNE